MKGYSCKMGTDQALKLVSEIIIAFLFTFHMDNMMPTNYTMQLVLHFC